MLVVPEHAHRVGHVPGPQMAQRDADAVCLAEELLVPAHRQAGRDDVAVQDEGAPRDGVVVPPDVLLGLGQDLVEAVVGEEDGPPDAAVGSDHDAVGEVAEDPRELQARDRKGPRGGGVPGDADGDGCKSKTWSSLIGSLFAMGFLFNSKTKRYNPMSCQEEDQNPIWVSKEIEMKTRPFLLRNKVFFLGIKAAQNSWAETAVRQRHVDVSHYKIRYAEMYSL